MYGALVGLGFQVAEDMFYFFTRFIGPAQGVNEIGALIEGYWIRVISGGLYSHPLYASLSGMGIAYWATRTDQPVSRRRLFLWGGLLLAIALHVFWNAPLLNGLLGDHPGPVNWLVFSAIKGIPLLIFIGVIVGLATRREQTYFRAITSPQVAADVVQPDELRNALEPSVALRGPAGDARAQGPDRRRPARANPARAAPLRDALDTVHPEQGERAGRAERADPLAARRAHGHAGPSACRDRDTGGRRAADGRRRHRHAGGPCRTRGADRLDADAPCRAARPAIVGPARSVAADDAARRLPRPDGRAAGRRLGEGRGFERLVGLGRRAPPDPDPALTSPALGYAAVIRRSRRHYESRPGRRLPAAARPAANDDQSGVPAGIQGDNGVVSGV